jgi:hypothetical protein
MRRRILWGFSILCTASVLAACGDAGDHFGEFRKNPPSPVAVSKLSLAMPIIAAPGSRHATLKLYITAYADNVAVPVGTALQNPIVINSNDGTGVTFGAKNVSSIQFTAAPGPVTVNYTAPAHPCHPPIAITAFNHDALPQVVVMDVVACGSPMPSPTPSTGPTTSPTTSPSSGPTTSPTTSPSTKPTTSPTPTPLPAVKRLVLSLSATPNPLGQSTFSMGVTAYNSAGAIIPTGTVLLNPIQLTSNSACSIGFGSAGIPSQVLTAAVRSVIVAYSPASSTCSPPNLIVINGFDADATPKNSSISILGGTATVSSITMYLLPSPPSTISRGVYRLILTANDSSGPIPSGVSLTNPIQLASNASCSTGFGDALNPGTYNSSMLISNTQTQVNVQFDPTNPVCTAPTGGQVVITASAAAATPISFSLSFPY